MSDPEHVRQAKRELGRKLAAVRQAAGLNQFELAAAVHYTRSTVANVEVGRQNAPSDFWIRCDDVLNAGGALHNGYDALCLLRTAHRQDTAREIRLPTRPEPAAVSGVAAVILCGSLADRVADLVA